MPKVEKSASTGPIELKVLGRLLAVAADGSDLLPRGRKARAILGYLALAGSAPTLRARLSGMLWDRVEESQAKQSFRQALKELTHAVAGCGAELILKPTADTIQIDTRACRIDIATLLSDIGAVDDQELERLGSLRLLEDCEGISATFDEWIAAEAATLEKRIRGRLETDLSRSAEASGDVEHRARAAQRLLIFDPTNEKASVALMRALVTAGNRVSAIREFERLRTALQSRLDARPSAAVFELYELIKASSSRAASPLVDRQAGPAQVSDETAGALQSTEPSRSGEALSRRLAAVLAIDIAGYSRLMGLDEEGTHRRVRNFLATSLRELIDRHGGRIANTMGDGALAEFASVVQAVRCAQEILSALPEINAGHSDDTAMQLRIAIHLGDIIIENGDISGDGVNIAARIQALARPNTICVTEAVAAQIADKFPFEFEDLGPQVLKNIRHPVRAFIVCARTSSPFGSDGAPGLTFPMARFDGRPAIAVLPYSITGAPDSDAAYLCEGLADDLIESLASWRIFPVIARNSSFQFRAASADIRQTGRELGARYVVQGAIRRRGIALQIGTRLMDAESGYEVVSHRVDVTEQELLGAEAGAARIVVGALEPEFLRFERDRVVRRTPSSSSAYELVMRGLWHHYQYTKDRNVEAVAFFRKASAADPVFAQARSAHAVSIIYAVQNRWAPDTAAALEEANELSRMAIALDPRDPMGHFSLGLGALWAGNIEDAAAALEDAIAINPSFAAAHGIICFALTYLGHPAEALEHGEAAVRLSPHDPRLSFWLPALAGACFHLGRYEVATNYARRALARRPGYGPSLRYLVASLVRRNLVEEAAQWVPQLAEAVTSMADLKKYLLRYYRVPAMRQDVIDALGRAWSGG